MNRKLRNRHRIMTTALAVIVPVIFLAGLAVRPEMPTSNALPGSEPTEHTPAGRFSIDGASFEFGRVVSGKALTAVVLAPQSRSDGLGKPDVLVYWSPQNPAGQPAPADGSYLLGALAPTQERLYELPPAAASNPGYLSFYSLAVKKMLQVEPDGSLNLALN